MRNNILNIYKNLYYVSLLILIVIYFFPVSIIGFIFYFVVTPIALLMRLLQKDLLNLRFNKNNTYWIKKSGPKSKMKNQF